MPGDERPPVAWVRAARPELAALEAELAAAERRLADPALAADLDAMTRALARRSASSPAGTTRAATAAEGEARGLLDELGVPDGTPPTS